MATDASNQIVTLRKLGIGLSLLAAGAPAPARGEQAADVQRTLEQLQDLTSNYALTDEQHLLRIKEIERQIDEAFAGIEQQQMMGCGEPAVAYLSVESSTPPGQFSESIWVHIIGTYGQWYFLFEAGTTLESAAQQINSMTLTVGVTAKISPVNPHRLEMHTVGALPYLSVKQTNGSAPVVHATAVGGKAVFHWIDYGCSIGPPVCAQPATLYLSTSYWLFNYGQGSTILIVQGFRGTQLFTFASGTTQNNIIAAINTFENNIGVTAVQNADNADRVELRSTFLGNDGFVTVMQVGGTPPIILQEPKGGVATYSAFANGVSRLPGDVNCDRIVNVADLILVVQNWGQCPLPPFVCEADLTNDGQVNVQDLWSVLNNWGSVD